MKALRHVSGGEVGREISQSTAPSVLIVEDDRVDAMILRELLERDGRFGPTRVVQDGEYALSCWTKPGARSPPELVFLDIHMPRMGGFEFLQAFEALPEEHKASTRVVMLIGGLEPRRDEARATNFSIVVGSLHKPFTSAAVAALADRLIND